MGRRNEHMPHNGRNSNMPQRRPQAPRSAIRAYEAADADAYGNRTNNARYEYNNGRQPENGYNGYRSAPQEGYNVRDNPYINDAAHGGKSGYERSVDQSRPRRMAQASSDNLTSETMILPVDSEISSDITRAKKERRRRAKAIKRGNADEVPNRRQLMKRIQKSFREAGMFGKKASGDEVLSSVVISDFDRKLVKRKNRWYNFRTNLVMLISLSIAVACMGIIVYQYTTSMQESNDLSDVADTYTEVAAPTAKDTSQLPPIVDFDGLKAINNEISGWLYIPGTVINYPVLTSQDQTKYLRKDYKGNHSTNGSIFTDYENSNDLNSDQHIVLYGHHLPWTAMFTEVQKYVEPDFFNSHKLAYFETPETTYVLAPIGSYNVNPDEYATRQVKFGSADDFQSYLDKRLQRCDKVKDEDAAKNRRTMDKLFTMITCDNHGKARAVVEWTVTASYPTQYVKNVIENSD